MNRSRKIYLAILISSLAILCVFWGVHATNQSKKLKAKHLLIEELENQLIIQEDHERQLLQVISELKSQLQDCAEN